MNVARKQDGYVGLLAIAFIAATVLGCGSTAAPTATVADMPTAALTRSPRAATPPAATPAPKPVPTSAATQSPTTLAFPNRSEVDLLPGRYVSSPHIFGGPLSSVVL